MQSNSPYTEIRALYDIPIDPLRVVRGGGGGLSAGSQLANPHPLSPLPSSPMKRPLFTERDFPPTTLVGQTPFIGTNEYGG